MRHRLFTSSSRTASLVIALVLTVVFVKCLELIVFNLPGFAEWVLNNTEPGEDDPLRIAVQREADQSSQRSDVVLLVGSSQAREGFDSELMNRIADDTHFRVRAGAGMSILDIWMQRDELVAEGPDAVYLVPYAGTFYQDYDYARLGYFFDLSGLPVILDSMGADELLNARVYFNALLSRASAFFRYRDILKRAIASSVRHWAQGTEPEHIRYNYLTSKPPSYFDETVERWGGTHYRHSRWAETEWRALRALVRYLQQRNIDVVLLDGPTHPRFHELAEEGVPEVYEQRLRWAARDLGLDLVDEQILPEFGPEHFVDFTHLNEEGRKRMSKFIAQHYEHRRAGKSHG